MSRRILRPLLVLLPMLVVFSSMTEAHADPFFPDPTTSVVVTRLTITNGAGWLVLQPRIGHDTAIGFEVTIPAGNGAWSGPASVPVPDLGISCVRKGGPALDYLCGSDDSWSDPPLLPIGGYQIAIRVTRLGTFGGLTGATRFWEINPYEGAAVYASDTFPVVSSAHFQSTAEVRNFYTDVTMPYNKRDGGDIAMTMTVVPGEQLQAVDVRLPPADWRLLAYQLGPQIRCRQSGGAAAPLIHCAAATDRYFTAGRYSFVVKVDLPAAEDFSLGQPGSIALTVNGAEPEVQDTFNWNNTVHY